MGEDREDGKGDDAAMTLAELSFDALLLKDRRRERQILLSEALILAVIGAIMIGCFRYLA